MKVSRRTLLQSGMAAALFPWLARADPSAPRKKLLLVFTPHGTVWHNWRPTVSGQTLTYGPILAPLNAHKQRLVLLDGMALPWGTGKYIPHTYTMPALWSGARIDPDSTLFYRSDHDTSFGWGTGTTVDQYIAQRLPAGETPYRSIELGTYCGDAHPAKRMIYSAPGIVKHPVDVPSTAFNQFFSAPNPDLEAAARELARRRSVLDTVLADMNARKATLTAADRARLDAHATAVRAIEARLEAETPDCDQPTAPGSSDGQNRFDQQIDLAAAALGCGLTRVMSLQMRIADVDGSVYPWIGLSGGTADNPGTLQGGHHHYTHKGPTEDDADEKLTQIYAWYSGRFSRLLDTLAATPDLAGGSVLDHTLVLWGSELGIGREHQWRNVPFVMAGGPGVVRGGQYLTFPSWTGSNTNPATSGHKSNHRLLVTALHWMGFTDLATYGAMDGGSGPLAGVLA